MATNWFYWALMSASFTAFAGIFPKAGLEDVNAELATWIRSFKRASRDSRRVWDTDHWSGCFGFGVQALTAE